MLLDRNADGRTIYFLDPASAAGFVARWCTAKKPLRALSGFGMTIGAATKAAVEQNRQATADCRDDVQECFDRRSNAVVGPAQRRPFTPSRPQCGRESR